MVFISSFCDRRLSLISFDFLSGSALAFVFTFSTVACLSFCSILSYVLLFRVSWANGADRSGRGGKSLITTGSQQKSRLVWTRLVSSFLFFLVPACTFFLSQLYRASGKTCHPCHKNSICVKMILNLLVWLLSGLFIVRGLLENNYYSHLVSNLLNCPRKKTSLGESPAESHA